MSKLNVDQKTILALFSDKKSDFLIPDYQRPYAWSKKKRGAQKVSLFFEGKQA